MTVVQRGRKPLWNVDRDWVVLTFSRATTVFGTPSNVTLAEIAIESFFPADDETALALVELLAE